MPGIAQTQTDSPATGGGGSGTILPETCEGRLTTESGVPVSPTDRTNQGTIYFTPCTEIGAPTINGNITLYSGSALVNVTFTQLSLALTVTSGKNYDVFVDYNSGTLQLVLSAAWTDDTTRADALGTQSGIIIKAGTAAYRWVGTIRASGTNVIADSSAQRYVSNAYNQVFRAVDLGTAVNDAHTYGTAAWREWHGGTNAVRATLVLCQPQTILAGINMGVLLPATGSNVGPAWGIGVDSTTAPYGPYAQFASGVVANGDTPAMQCGSSPALTAGYHEIVPLEFSAGTSTFYYYYLSVQAWL